MPRDLPTLRSVRARSFTIPTEQREADGTLSWTSTSLVIVEIEGGGRTGFGYSYGSGSIVPLITGKFAEILEGSDALDPSRATRALVGAARNMGRDGLAALAISAIDLALWDLKGKLLDLPLALLLGRMREAVPIYGSGGFTSYDERTLSAQLGGWVERDGCRWVKMKVGSEPAQDLERVAQARRAVGKAGLFVDANGAYGVKQAIGLAKGFAEHGVLWFEEPVSSDDLEGLALVRRHIPAPMEVAAGEYAFDADNIRRLLEARAVDVLQADITRCLGITGFLQAAALSDAFHVDLSAHCAPSAHLHAACAVPRLRHLEWFHDHVRIEQMLLDGAPSARDGTIRPDLSRPGLGLALRAADAEHFAD